MPRNIAQWTGVVVTAIVTFGTDMDAFNAVPLGIFAGMLATFFIALADGKAKLAALDSKKR
jgi:hypothetical protein